MKTVLPIIILFISVAMVFVGLQFTRLNNMAIDSKPVESNIVGYEIDPTQVSFKILDNQRQLEVSLLDFDSRVIVPITTDITPSELFAGWSVLPDQRLIAPLNCVTVELVQRNIEQNTDVYQVKCHEDAPI